MNPTSPPASPRPGLLPIFVQQAETTQLLRPLAIVQQQQFIKPPRSWSGLLQRLASKRAAGLFYALLAVMLVWYVAGGRARPPALVAVGGQQPQQLQSTIVAATSSTTGSNSTASSSSVKDGGQVMLVASTLQQPAVTGTSTGSSSSSSESPPAAGDSLPADASSSSGAIGSSSGGSANKQGGCPYGSLPGTWVGDAPTGAKWQLLDPHCQLKNWIQAYAAAAAVAAPSEAGGDTSSSSSSGSSAEVLPTVNVLLLSDSVDRYIVQHVCDYLHGTKHTMHPTVQQQPPTAADEAAAAAVAAGLQQGVPESQQDSTSSPSSSSSSGPSSLNATAYAFHTCQLPEGVPLKLASSYFPGVHPTGPFHRWGLGAVDTGNAWTATTAYDASKHVCWVGGAGAGGEREGWCVWREGQYVWLWALTVGVGEVGVGMKEGVQAVVRQHVQVWREP